jgi:Tol biopolymer transport system component
MMKSTPLAALVAVLSLAACDGLFEPSEPAPEQLIFKRYARATINNLNSDSLDLYRVNADGTGLQNLTGHLAQYGSLSSSPDGRKVVFQSDRGTPGVSHVWVMNSNGTGIKQLTTPYSHSPRWSPDGARIAFMMGGTDGMHVYVANADGSNPIKVSEPAMQVGNACGTNPGGTRIDFVDWIPDGRIAFTRHYCGYGYRYFLVNADGSGFTQTDIKLWEAFWSPDGTKVVFPRHEGGYWKVMLANADGSGARVLSTQGTHQGLQRGLTSPWSPDGKQVVFFAETTTTQVPWPDHCTESAAPYVVNVDGSGATRLMDGCRGFFSGWSASGEQVAFTIFPGTESFPESLPDVHVMNADGTGAVNVTSSPQWEGDPVWLGRR